MASAASPQLFTRRTLDQVIEVPDNIISVYVVEKHIWDGVSDEAKAH